MTRRPHRRDLCFAPRGVTLVELMVGLAVVSVVLAMAGTALVSTMQVVNRGARQRGSQSQARAAAAFVERSLRMAGLGIDPALAFDFSVYRGLGASCASPGRVPPSADCQRDFADRPDELVFYARDPAYWGSIADAATEGRAWTVAAADAAGSTLTLTLHGGEVLLPGQILQVVCSGGAKVAYVTNQTRVNNPARGTVQLLGLGLTAAGDPFHQPGALADPCFGDGTARAFAVDRFRFHVASYPDGAEQVPYLMLDTGLDRTGAGVGDPGNEIPIAEGIEDFQVVYERPSGPAPGGVENAWVGETPGTVLDPASFCARLVWTGAVPCGVPDPPKGSMALVDFVLIRHGESTWNLDNRFTGWTHVPLTDLGVEQAKASGRLLKEAGYEFDLAYTSVLKRAIWTLWYCLDVMDRTWLPVVNDWRLNERHYGALQGAGPGRPGLRPRGGPGPPRHPAPPGAAVGRRRPAPDGPGGRAERQPGRRRAGRHRAGRQCSGRAFS